MKLLHLAAVLSAVPSIGIPIALDAPWWVWTPIGLGYFCYFATQRWIWNSEELKQIDTRNAYWTERRRKRLVREHVIRGRNAIRRARRGRRKRKTEGMT